MEVAQRNKSPANYGPKPAQPIGSDAVPGELFSRDAKGPVIDRSQEAAPSDQEVFQKYVCGGTPPNATPLIQRQQSLGEIMAEYTRSIRRQMSQPDTGDVPFVGTILNKMLGVVALCNPFKRYEFSQNEGGQLEMALLESGNEAAYECAGKQPCILVGKGDFTEAFVSFRKALEAAPHRLQAIYSTIADLSLNLWRWQRLVREGDSAYKGEVTKELNDYWRGPTSQNIIEISTPSNGLSPVWSCSGITDNSPIGSIEPDWSKFEKAIKASSIPFDAIARAAFRLQLDLLEEYWKRSDTVRIGCPTYMDRIKGCIALLSGDYLNAIALFEKFERSNEGRRGLRGLEHCELVWALSEAGKHPEALRLFGEKLVNAYPNPDSHHYLQLLELARKVAGDSDPKSALNLALPYLKARLDLMLKVHGERHRDWRLTFHYAQALEALGERGQATELYKITEAKLRGRLSILELDGECRSELYLKLRTELEEVRKRAGSVQS